MHISQSLNVISSLQLLHLASISALTSRSCVNHYSNVLHNFLDGNGAKLWCCLTMDETWVRYLVTTILHKSSYVHCVPEPIWWRNRSRMTQKYSWSLHNAHMSLSTILCHCIFRSISVSISNAKNDNAIVRRQLQLRVKTCVPSVKAIHSAMKWMSHKSSILNIQQLVFVYITDY